MLYGLFSKERFLEIIKDFILFEGGVVKKSSPLSTVFLHQ